MITRRRRRKFSPRIHFKKTTWRINFINRAAHRPRTQLFLRFYKKNLVTPTVTALRIPLVSRILLDVSTKYWLFKKLFKKKRKTSVNRSHHLSHFNSRVRHKKSFFLAYDKPLMEPLRNARLAHWELIPGNTLHRKRYHKFLFKDIRSRRGSDFLNCQLPALIQQLNICRCWSDIFLLIKCGLFFVNGVQIFRLNYKLFEGDIVQLAGITPLEGYLRANKRKVYKINKFFKKLRYLDYLRWSKPWMSRKNKISFKKYKLQLTRKHKFIVQWDHFSQTCVYLSNQLHKYHPFTPLYFSTLLRLNNWRFYP